MGKVVQFFIYIYSTKIYLIIILLLFFAVLFYYNVKSNNRLSSYEFSGCV